MNQWAALAMAAAAVALFAWAAVGYWGATRGKAARRIRMRLEALTTGAPVIAEATLIKSDARVRAAWMQSLVAQLSRGEHLKRLVAQAGLEWTAERFLTATVLAFFGGFVVALLMMWWVLAVAVGLGASFLPYGYLCRQRSKRLQKFETQFPEALDLISRALRAGHAFGSGLKVAAEQGPEPIATEFRLATEQINLGLSVPQALTNLSDRIPLADIRFFVTAVLIQRETGGNLTEILGNISTLIRERLKLFANIRVLSAEGRLSAWILIALPISAALLINVVNPGYLGVLFTDPLGQRIVAGGGVMMVVGIVWIRRTIRIRV
jgi:tight adherence protein B